jgi:hypothetical protein
MIVSPGHISDYLVVGDNMNDALRIPDIEIVVRAATSDVAVICFWEPTEIHGDWECCAAITDKHDVVHIRACLQAAIQQINSSLWVSLDVLGDDETEEIQEPPF